MGSRRPRPPTGVPITAGSRVSWSVLGFFSSGRESWVFWGRHASLFFKVARCVDTSNDQYAFFRPREGLLRFLFVAHGRVHARHRTRFFFKLRVCRVAHAIRYRARFFHARYLGRRKSLFHGIRVLRHFFRAVLHKVYHYFNRRVASSRNGSHPAPLRLTRNKGEVHLYPQGYAYLRPSGCF